MSKNHKTHTIKNILIIGNSNVGKTTFAEKWVYDDFINYNLETIGINILFKKFIYDNIETIFCLWDFGGRKKYMHIIESYHKNANVIFLCFNINDLKSFDDINVWYENIIKAKSENNDNNNNSFDSPRIFLIGLNKRKPKSIPYMTCLNWASNHNLSYHEVDVSVLSSQNLDDIFIRTIMDGCSHKIYIHHRKHEKNKKKWCILL